MGCVLDLLTQLGTTSNYDTISDCHTANHSMLSLISLSLEVAWKQLSTMAIPMQCFHWMFPGNES
jgi:hypothetical protein